MLGGWQVNSFFNFQTGVPLSALNGFDPAGANTSATAIRPNVFTNLDVSRMTVAQLHLINQQQRDLAIAQAQQIFRALPSGPCVPGWLPGPSLPFTLFSAPRGRINCNAQGARTLVLDFNGVPEGQRVGKAGRNIMRADPIRNVDIGIKEHPGCRKCMNPTLGRSASTPERIQLDVNAAGPWEEPQKLPLP